MQTQIFPPKEVAMELKKVGFNEECIAMYFGYDRNESITPYPYPRYMNNETLNDTACTAPTYDQVIGWFAEVHGMDIDICGSIDMTEYSTDVWHDKKIILNGSWITDRQQSLLTAFNEAIKLIQK